MLFSDVKLIVWDLDDTLWQGTLMQGDALILREAFVAYIKETAKHGVVHSLCSKNDFEIAEKALKEAEQGKKHRKRKTPKILQDEKDKKNK